MPPAQRKTTLHGVEIQQTQLQNKWYTPVDARVKIAEHADPALIRRPDAGYSVVAVQFVQIADRWAYHCLVEYPVGSGVIAPGTDFIDTKDPSGVAKAETSAIGRALGLHGIAIEESIASADEMSRVADAADDTPARATATPQPQQPAQSQPRAPKPASQPAPAQRDAGRPTAASATQGKAHGWVTVDGYDPLSDMELRSKVKRIGVTTMSDFEKFLSDAQGYTTYNRAAINTVLTIWEGRYADVQAKLAAAGAVEG